MKKIFFTTIASVALLASDAALAHAQNVNGSLQSPLAFPNIQTFISEVLKTLVVIALPFIAFFIVYSGFLFVLARGNQGQLEKAKQNFLYVIIGAILILGAWVIATLIGGTVSQIVGS